MANRYYVEAGNWSSNGRGSVRIVIRIDIPASNNLIGFGWQTAAAEWWALLPVDAQVTNWPGADTVLLALGTEHEFIFSYQTNRDRPGIVAELEAAVAVRITEAQQDLQDRLSYWGKTATV
jgi:hypothetical protein